MRILGYRPSMSTLVAVVAVVVAVGGIAYAAIPSSSGVIQGCYQKINGSLRVVEAASECKKNEQAIQWNQRGPQGPPGLPGISGYELVDRRLESPLPINGFFQAFCPSSTKVLGGGARVQLLNDAGNVVGEGSPVQSSVALAGGGGWEVHVNQSVVGGATRFRLRLTATCANVAP